MSGPMVVPSTTELTKRAMGTDVHLIVVGGPEGLLAGAAAMVDELEQRWSRFLPDSEISRLNAAAGRPVAVSEETIELVERAIAGWRNTGGRFDPTLLGEVMAAGYDRSFEQIGDREDDGDTSGGPARNTSVGGTSRCGAIVVDRL